MVRAVLEDAWRIFTATLRELPNDGPTVRGLALRKARHEALEGFWTAKAAALGLTSPEALQAEDRATKHGQRAERVAVTMLDIATALAKGSPSRPTVPLGFELVTDATETPMTAKKGPHAKIRVLPQWIHDVTPRFAPPEHLSPITELFAQIAGGEEIRSCLSAPPRHAKTTTLEHGVAWLLAQNPGRRVIWASRTVSGLRGARSSRRVRELAARVGVPLAADAKARANWRTGIDDGGFWCTSVGGSITGEGADLLIVDDPRERARRGGERSTATAWPPGSTTTR